MNVFFFPTRDAAQNWEKDCSKTLEEINFVRGTASACVFWSSKLNERLVVHGSDFAILASERTIRYIADELVK